MELEGKRSAYFTTIRDATTNGGADWCDAELVQKAATLLWRVRPDLPAFCRTISGARGE